VVERLHRVQADTAEAAVVETHELILRAVDAPEEEVLSVGGSPLAEVPVAAVEVEVEAVVAAAGMPSQLDHAEAYSQNPRTPAALRSKTIEQRRIVKKRKSENDWNANGLKENVQRTKPSHNLRLIVLSREQRSKILRNRLSNPRRPNRT
jgi:hypothetical protein